MRKRAALARALALDPPLLFLDEPTAGLDPIVASELDALVRDLKESLGLTVFMVTHDIDSLIAIADRIAVLVDNVVRIGTMEEMLRDPHPWIRAYFRGPRGRAATRAPGARVRRWRRARPTCWSAASSWCSWPASSLPCCGSRRSSSASK